MHTALIRFERSISALLLFSLFSLVMLQIVSRYLYFMPITWTEEAARYTMIWLTFIAAAQVTSADGHISINLVDRVSSKTALRYYVAFSRLIVFGTCMVLMPGGWRFVSAMMSVNTPASDIPFGYVYAAALVGLALIGLHALVSAYLVLVGKLEPTAPPELMETGIIAE